MRSKSFIARKIAVWRTNRKLRNNSKKRAQSQWEERAQKSLEKAIMRKMIHLRGAAAEASAKELANQIMRDSLHHIFQHGVEKGSVLRRQAIQQEINSLRSSNISPYKLSGIERNEEWVRAVENSIENKEFRVVGNTKIIHGNEAAEIHALEKWLNKSSEHKQKMEEWLAKHHRAKKPITRATNKN